MNNNKKKPAGKLAHLLPRYTTSTWSCVCGLEITVKGPFRENVDIAVERVAHMRHLCPWSGEKKDASAPATEAKSSGSSKKKGKKKKTPTITPGGPPTDADENGATGAQADHEGEEEDQEEEPFEVIEAQAREQERNRLARLKLVPLGTS